MGNETNARGPEMPQKLEIKEDERGKLIEIFKIPEAGQFVYITTKPGVTRGNHYHLRKKEKYCVIEGEAKISLRNLKNNETKEYNVSGKAPEVVEIPINWTHNIKNIGKGELKFLAWVNEIFDRAAPDAYAEQV